MPVINFTTADVMRSKILEKGWRPMQITAVTGPTPNKAKDGVNFTVTFTLIDSGDLDGKEFQRVFSSKAISMMLGLVAAVRGIKQNEIPKESFSVDTDELLGKKIDGLVDTDTYEGQLKNICEVYLPYKTSSNQQPF